MSGHEVALGLAWINTTITGDTTLMSLVPGGCHRGAAPKEDVNNNPLVPPFAIFNFVSGSDKTSMNGYRCLVRALFQIKATGLGDAAHATAVASAAARIDALFGGPTRGTTTGGIIHSCIRESPVQYDEPAIAGVFFTHFGGIYEILIEAT